MTSSEQRKSDNAFMQRTVEAALRIGVIAGLVAWCFLIARPFLVPIIWGAIIAIAVFHGYDRLQAAVGGRRITAAVLATLLMLLLLVVPSVLLGDSLVSGARKVVDLFQSGEFKIPPPPESVAVWPLIGEPIAKTWALASQDFEEALRQASPLLKGFGAWLLGAAAGAGLALLQFVLAIVISGAFLANSEAAGRMTEAVAIRLAGDRGLEFARVAEQTVRSVASGILGVALIQALLAGLGFLVAGVPAAGLLDSRVSSFWRDPVGRGDRFDPGRDLLILDGGHTHRNWLPDLGQLGRPGGQHPQAHLTGPRRRRAHAYHFRWSDWRFSQRGHHRTVFRRRRSGPRLQAVSCLAGSRCDD